MANTLLIGKQAYAEMMAHLLKNQLEQVAFIFATASDSAGGVKFTGSGLYLVPPKELAIQSSFHVELSESTQGKLIKEAWDRGTSLIEIHSHPTSRFAVGFSASDLAGFREFVPHVWWRLKGRPYAAIVVGPSGFDALVWRSGPDTPERLDYLQHGDAQRRPSSITLRKLGR